MRHFLSLQALQAVRFFLSTTHLKYRETVSFKENWIGWRGAQAILMKYARRRSMEDVVVYSHTSAYTYQQDFLWENISSGVGGGGVDLCVEIC
jgi:hypothetical protein